METRRQPLTKERIIHAALQLGREQGLDGLSMRRVARELGVEAMSLYNHVPNKAAIINGMVEHAFSCITLPSRDLPWTQRLRVLGHSMHQVFSANPIVVTIIATGLGSPRSLDGLLPIEEILAAMYAAGFEPKDARRSADALTAQIFGAIQLQPAWTINPEVDQDEHNWLQQHIRPDTLPHLHRTLRSEHSPGRAQDFAYQLDLLIAGLAARAPQ
ncbi:TetR/AcrR family transcriptional regulator [Nonomuraea sp. NPDC050643]|uniref:TetR/AcrR family transcriptional regulator n=1 Tax=Nonomuraea sp. NPDC050643 TaxID=3155660 RepID=UPI0033E61612